MRNELPPSSRAGPTWAARPARSRSCGTSSGSYSATCGDLRAHAGPDQNPEDFQIILSEGAPSHAIGQRTDPQVLTIDLSSVTSMNRVLTRAIASQIYAEQDPTSGEPLYAGIHYISKLGHFDCWALFGDRFVVDEQFRGPIEQTDSELLKVANSWGLTIH